MTGDITVVKTAALETNILLLRVQTSLMLTSLQHDSADTQVQLKMGFRPEQTEVRTRLRREQSHIYQTQL